MVNFVANNGERMVEYEWETRGDILKAITSGQKLNSTQRKRLSSVSAVSAGEACM